MIIPISDHRLVRIFADVQTEMQQGQLRTDEVIAIGQIIRDVTDLWSGPIGNVVVDASGALWLERASLDTSLLDPVPNSYLARNVASFQQVAALNCAASKLSILPRSQQWKWEQAEASFRDWVQLNDPQCLDDPGSFWLELRSDEY